MAADKTGATPAATSATLATTAILRAPHSYAEAEAFALDWLRTKRDSQAMGWQVKFRVTWDDEGRFVSATIERQFVGFDLGKEVEKAIAVLQYDKPIDESRNALLHMLWEKQRELESKAGRPTGSSWAGTIWTIAHLLKCSGFQLSRNPESPETSAFDAIANAMRALGLAPNSYSGVKSNFYDYAKRNSLC